MTLSLATKYSWSKGEIGRLGEAIRDETPFDQDLYDDWVQWHVEVLDAVGDVVSPILTECVNAWSEDPVYFYSSQQPPLLVRSSRAKTIDTTREKLQRHKTPLPRIQDIAGYRIDGSFTLNGQSAIAELISEALLAAGAERSQIHDLRETPHSGYRAIHLRIKAPCGLVEIQIRTQLQSVWANLFEISADLLGREIRYQSDSEVPEWETVRRLWEHSSRAYDLEKLWRDVQDLKTGTSHAKEGGDIAPSYFVEKADNLATKVTKVMTEQMTILSSMQDMMEDLRDEAAQEGR